MKNERSGAARRAAVLGLASALALIFGYVEFIIPFDLGIPGVKLGLANLVVVAALYLLRPREALLVTVVKIFASGLLFGNAMSLLYSLCGGLLSFAAMALTHRSGRLGVAGVSMLGGVCHNIGQLAAAALVLRSLKIAFYLPMLLAAGVITGLVIGVIAAKILPLLEKAYKKS